jgi:stage V sporulation protein SpoVS
VYQPHAGTLKISRTTVPGRAAGRALSLLRQESAPLIDFFVIGGGANYQAMKAMSLFRYYLEDETDRRVTLAFTPIHVRTTAQSSVDLTEHETDATVWRTIILTNEQREILAESMFDEPPSPVNPEGDAP